MSEFPATARGVFLSYAREDTDTARRIAQALRGFGVEVWFDQSELRGGDAWDAKIRKEIKDCALFVPIISAQTQARGEGYFRREWKLAVDRSHDMASGRSFIVPVVIDQTAENDAEVPEEFMKFQWTRLPNGEPSPDFVALVKGLLAKPRRPALKPDVPKPPTLPPMLKAAARTRKAAAGSGDSAQQTRPGLPGWTWGAIVAVAVGVAVALYVALKPKPAEPSGVGRSAPGGLSPSNNLSVGHSAAPTPPAAAVQPPLDFANAKSIAVLPFANFSTDKDNEFFADGMHDEVITALAKIHDLTVTSRTSVMAYKNPEGRNLRKIAADLGVATVLEGSVQRAGSQVKVIVQLIDARNDRHLWAETYVENLTDIFSIQSKLATAITAALKATLSPEEKSRIARRPTQNPAAYDLYLRARVLDQNLGLGATKAEYESVIHLYEQAAAQDPAFALPHVQASIVHGTMYWFPFIDATPERLALARAEVETAQRLAPDAPETHLALGSFEYTCRNDWAKALAEYHAAEAGLPNDAQLQYRIALAHRRLLQLPEALARLETAVALNPNDSGGVSTYFEVLSALRRYRQVVDRIGRFRAIFPGESRLGALERMARFELDGDRPAFLRAGAALPPASTDPHGLTAAYVLAVDSGDFDAAERVLADPRQPEFGGAFGIGVVPRSLVRAYLAWLRGRPEDARRFASEAIPAIKGRKWEPRQLPAAGMMLAQAEAYSGRFDDAQRDAKAALAEEQLHDAFQALTARRIYGSILIICNRRDEALAVLREMMSGPGAGGGPNEIRFDPIWSRLKDDPRFEEILRSAKPL